MSFCNFDVDTQSKGNHTKILQHEDQVALLVEFAGGAFVAVVTDDVCPLQILQRCSANVSMTANARESHATRACVQQVPTTCSLVEH